jgi:hypothetical protein
VSQDAALQSLIAEHTLTEQQAYAVRTALAKADRAVGPRRWMAEVAGYLGGALVLGGGALLLGTSWDELTDASRSALLAAITFVLGLAGLVIAGGPGALFDLADGRSSARRRVGAALFALASGTAAGSAGVLAEHRTVLAVGAVGLVVAAAGYALLPSAFGLLSTAAFGVMLSIAVVEEAGEATPLRVAVGMVVVGVAFGLLTEAGLLVPRDFALGVGAVIALVGAQQPLAQSDAVGWAYALTFAIGLACFVLYWLRESAAVLIVGVVAVAVAVPEAVWDLTNGAIGGAAVLLVSGATLLLVSAFGLRLWRGRSDRRDLP